MMTRCLVIGFLSVAMTWLADSCEAQISVGISRQGGIVTGGSLQIGGFVNPGRTGVRLGVSAANNQLQDIQTFSFQSGAGNPGVIGRSQQPRATPGQFVRTAQGFDENHDALLDELELAAIGAAVLAELEQRKTASNPRRTVAARPVLSAEELREDPQIKAFVKRCLRYDKDQDGALNKRETGRMAKSLIRTLQ
jgi:hypothetical protein